VILRNATVEEAAAIARVQVDTWRSAYSGILPASVLAALDVERRTIAWTRIHRELTEREHLLVATLDERVIGFASGGPNRTANTDYEGEIYALYLRVEHQRCGTGRDLFCASIARLADAEMPSVMLWCLQRTRVVGFTRSSAEFRCAPRWTKSAARFTRRSLMALDCEPLRDCAGRVLRPAASG
jgi:hypothetical protein